MSTSDSCGRRARRALNRLPAHPWQAPYSALGLPLAVVVLAPGASVRRGAGALQCNGGLPGRYVVRLPLHRQFARAEPAEAAPHG